MADGILDLTLGIPLYNSENTLAETIRSVAEQALRPRDIYVIDDHSTDRSREIAQRLLVSYGLTNAKLLSNSQNVGIAGTYNKIAALSHNKWTQILDADDMLQKNYYDKLQHCLEETDALAVISGMTINVLGLNGLTAIASKLVSSRPPLFAPLLGTLATRSGVIYRTSV